MEELTAVVIGLVVACAVYLMLARNVLRFIFGLVLISNAANLVIFLGGRLTEGTPPLIPYGETVLAPGAANALPQALVLTAIVIGFGLFAFALILMFRVYSTLGTLDSDEMRLAEPRAEVKDADASPADASDPMPQPDPAPRQAEAAR